jgi:hypothetical protein
VSIAVRFPSPLINEACANILAPRNLRHHGARRFNHRQNPRAVFVTPTMMSFTARD